MTNNDVDLSIRELSIAFSKVEDPELIYDFLNCILTNSEIGEISSRWSLVRRIKKGETQRSIAKDLGISLCKITRGSKELKKDNSAFKKFIDIYEETI
jgi:TrpR family transcriptional regulator, trp operon repressor